MCLVRFVRRMRNLRQLSSCACVSAPEGGQPVLPRPAESVVPLPKYAGGMPLNICLAMDIPEV